MLITKKDDFGKARRQLPDRSIESFMFFFCLPAKILSAVIDLWDSNIGSLAISCFHAAKSEIRSGLIEISCWILHHLDLDFTVKDSQKDGLGHVLGILDATRNAIRRPEDKIVVLLKNGIKFRKAGDVRHSGRRRQRFDLNLKTRQMRLC